MLCLTLRIMTAEKDGGEWLEVMSGWILLIFLVASYICFYLYFNGTLTRRISESKIELTAVMLKVKQKIGSTPPATKIGRTDDDALTG